MKYYSALKRNEILTHATTEMNLENIMLSETSQPQKDKYYTIPLIWIVKFIETESVIESTRMLGQVEVGS